MMFGMFGIDRDGNIHGDVPDQIRPMMVAVGRAHHAMQELLDAYLSYIFQLRVFSEKYDVPDVAPIILEQMEAIIRDSIQLALRWPRGPSNPQTKRAAMDIQDKIMALSRYSRAWPEHTYGRYTIQRIMPDGLLRRIYDMDKRSAAFVESIRKHQSLPIANGEQFAGSIREAALARMAESRDEGMEAKTRAVLLSSAKQFDELTAAGTPEREAMEVVDASLDTLLMAKAPTEQDIDDLLDNLT